MAANNIQVPGGQPVGGKPPFPKGGAAKPGSLKDEFRRKPALVVGAGGVAVVVIYALMKRNSTAAAGADTGTGSAATQNSTPSYDSTGTDVYNSLADQLTSLQGQIAGLTPPPQGVVTPPPATTPKAPSIKAGFYRNASTGNIYEVANGNRFAVTPKTWKTLNAGKNVKVNNVDNSWNGLQVKLQKTRV